MSVHWCRRQLLQRRPSWSATAMKSRRSLRFARTLFDAVHSASVFGASQRALVATRIGSEILFMRVSRKSVHQFELRTVKSRCKLQVSDLLISLAAEQHYFSS